MALSQEYPPDSTDEDLRDFLIRRFVDVDNNLKQASKFPVRKEMPYKPQVGDIHFFGDPLTHNYDPVITKASFWGLTDLGWVDLAQSGGGSGGSGFQGYGRWRYQDAITDDPGAGELQFNNADINLATELYVNEVNNLTTDMSTFLDLIISGDLIYIQDQTDPDKFVTIEVGTSTFSLGVYTFPILNVEFQGAAITDDTVTAMIVTHSGQIPVPDQLLLINRAGLPENITIVTSPTSFLQFFNRSGASEHIGIV